jgi:hypothetical protein
MGMATTEQEKQLKKLLVEQKKKSNDLKRLKAEQAAKKRAREMKKVRKSSFIIIKPLNFDCPFSVKSKHCVKKILNLQLN